MTCHFCGMNKPLCKAHIIPRSFFKEVTPSKGHAMSLSSHSERKEFHQAGIYDTSILCKECDNKLGTWDAAGIEFFRTSNTWPKITLKSPMGEQASYYEIPTFDYKNLKLFFIATLWRMSLSNLSFYKAVSLGPYETIAKQMLKEENPGTENDFSIILCKFDASRYSDQLHKVFTGPNYIKSHPFRNHYRFTMAGYGIGMKVDKRRPDEPFPDIWMSPSIPLRIVEGSFDTSWAFKLVKSIASDRNRKGYS